MATPETSLSCRLVFEGVARLGVVLMQLIMNLPQGGVSGLLGRDQVKGTRLLIRLLYDGLGMT